MPRKTIDFDTMRDIGLALPGVEQSTAYGSPALKVRGKLLACLPAHRSAEPASLVVCVDFDERAELLAGAPDVYYVTDHYVDYRSVLVRLSRVTPSMLRDLLGMAHKLATKGAPSRKREPPEPDKGVNNDLTPRGSHVLRTAASTGSRRAVKWRKNGAS